jgi:hypothetical protein
MKGFTPAIAVIPAAAIIRPKQPIRQYAAIQSRAEEFWPEGLRTGKEKP